MKGRRYLVLITTKQLFLLATPCMVPLTRLRVFITVQLLAFCSLMLKEAPCVKSFLFLQYL